MNLSLASLAQIEQMKADNASLRTQLSAAEQKLARIKAVADADAKDLATMRDGTKLTRSGIVEVVAYLQEELAECYRLTGADPDGNEDWRLARSAVSEVRRLRQESDDTEEKLLSAEQRVRDGERQFNEQVRDKLRIANEYEQLRKSLEQHITSLTAERDELRKDAERLDAIFNRDIIENIDFYGTTTPYWTIWTAKGEPLTTAEYDAKTIAPRDIIDAAIDGTGQPVVDHKTGKKIDAALKARGDHE